MAKILERYTLHREVPLGPGQLLYLDFVVIGYQCLEA
jgi:hypothetical protein